MTNKSHPSWVCGLKLLVKSDQAAKSEVTPFVGVWIETQNMVDIITNRLVTPFVGVWIETVIIEHLVKLEKVTPFVGVWIETQQV